MRFDKIRELNFEACPGEEKCETKPSEGHRESGPPHRIYQIRERQPETTIEQICAGCKLKETKPGTEPMKLSHAIYIAYELEEDDLVCSGFEYPAILDYLDPFEWVCITAIKAARRNSENKSVKPPQQQDAPRSHQMEHLKQLSHG